MSNYRVTEINWPLFWLAFLIFSFLFKAHWLLRLVEWRFR